MKWFLIHWVTTGVALGAAAWILPGVTIPSMRALAVASLVLGVVNTVVKPVLVVLTLPLTVMSLGVFYFVVNGVTFALAAWIVPGFRGGVLLLGNGGRRAGRPDVDVHRQLPLPPTRPVPRVALVAGKGAGLQPDASETQRVSDHRE